MDSKELPAAKEKTQANQQVTIKEDVETATKAIAKIQRNLLAGFLGEKKAPKGKLKKMTKAEANKENLRRAKKAIESEEKKGGSLAKPQVVEAHTHTPNKKGRQARTLETTEKKAAQEGNEMKKIKAKEGPGMRHPERGSPGEKKRERRKTKKNITKLHKTGGSGINQQHY